MICEYTVGENQHKSYSFLIDETSALHDMHIRFYLERNAMLVAEILIASVDAQVIIDCVLRGEGADARIMGAYILDAAHKVTIATTQHHSAAHTRSALI